MTGLMCYNRGCGKTFDPRNNPPDSTACRYHPGSPYFHETYKGWNCCGKKSTDFTDFLNTPGCKTGPHSREKPVEPESITGKKDDRSLEDQLAALNSHEPSPEPLQRLPRPDWATAPLTKIKVAPTPSFQKTIDADGASVASSIVNAAANAGGGDGSVVKEGESCKHGGCKAVRRCRSLQSGPFISVTSKS